MQEPHRGSAHRKGVNPTPKWPHPQICDFPKFDCTFLETVKSDFAQIFSVDRGSEGLANGVETSKIRLPVIEGKWAKVGKNPIFKPPYLPKWGEMAPIQKEFLSESQGL